MKYIGELLKGVIIGIANILPGISGGMLAISMGVYDTIIHAVNQLFKEPAKSIKTLFPYGVGMALGIISLSLVFEYLFGTFPLQTKLAFIGLIGGGLPALFERVKTAKPRERQLFVITACITCAVVILLTVIGGMTIASRSPRGGETVKMGVQSLACGRFWVISLFFVGVLAAATMVIPGVSGSMILMMIGMYEPLLQTTNACIRAAASMDFPMLWASGMILAPYFAGIVIGCFLFAAIVEHLLIHHKRQMYCVIIGLVFSSPIVILWDAPWSQVEPYQLFFGISLCLLGYVAVERCKGDIPLE